MGPLDSKYALYPRVTFLISRVGNTLLPSKKSKTSLIIHSFK